MFFLYDSVQGLKNGVKALQEYDSVQGLKNGNPRRKNGDSIPEERGLKKEQETSCFEVAELKFCFSSPSSIGWRDVRALVLVEGKCLIEIRLTLKVYQVVYHREIRKLLHEPLREVLLCLQEAVADVADVVEAEEDLQAEGFPTSREEDLQEDSVPPAEDEDENSIGAVPVGFPAAGAEDTDSRSAALEGGIHEAGANANAIDFRALFEFLADSLCFRTCPDFAHLPALINLVFGLTGANRTLLTQSRRRLENLRSALDDTQDCLSLIIQFLYKSEQTLWEHRYPMNSSALGGRAFGAPANGGDFLPPLQLPGVACHLFSPVGEEQGRFELLAVDWLVQNGDLRMGTHQLPSRGEEVFHVPTDAASVVGHVELRHALAAAGVGENGLSLPSFLSEFRDLKVGNHLLHELWRSAVAAGIVYGILSILLFFVVGGNMVGDTLPVVCRAPGTNMIGRCR